jgi:hypothetical protein
MLKTIITPHESAYTLTIPAKKVEVLLHSTDDFLENKKSNGKKPSDFFGTFDYRLPDSQQREYIQIVSSIGNYRTNHGVEGKKIRYQYSKL